MTENILEVRNLVKDYGDFSLKQLCFDVLMLSRLVDTFFSRTSWTMLPYVENHSISVA